MDEREANEWWDSLPPERRVSIFRWIAHGERASTVHEDQATILDEVNA